FFTPSHGGVKGSKLLTDKPVEATLDQPTGVWTVPLESTDGIVPAGAFYTVSIDQGMHHFDVLELRIYLPEGTWTLGTLPGAPLQPNYVLVSLSPPPVGYRGWYLNSGIGDPNNPAESGTGILEIVS